MPTLVTFNGTNYNIPLAGETGWGDQVNAFLVAVANAALVSGGNPVTLTIDNLISKVDILQKTSTVVADGDSVSPTRTNISLSALAAITLSAITAISDGTADGQVIILSGSSDTHTITILDGANTLMNGDVILGNGESIEFKWDATLKWVEQRRSN